MDLPWCRAFGGHAIHIAISSSASYSNHPLDTRQAFRQGSRLARGKVIGDCMSRHRAKEFLKFLRNIDKAVPAGRDVHLILDNYATHKTPDVRAWLGKHPRFKLHFTPTSASWLNLVERFFAQITSRRIRRGSYSSVDDLGAAIFDCLAQHNEKPKPFRWTKTVEDILAKERRALDALDEIRGNR